MFTFFKHKAEARLSPRCTSMISADARELIRVANHSERMNAGRAQANRRRTLELRVVSNAERRLASSIATAISGAVDARLVVESAITPVLLEAPLVSEFAHACIGRALKMAEHY